MEHSARFATDRHKDVVRAKTNCDDKSTIRPTFSQLPPSDITQTSSHGQAKMQGRTHRVQTISARSPANSRNGG